MYEKQANFDAIAVTCFGVPQLAAAFGEACFAQESASKLAHWSLDISVSLIELPSTAHSALQGCEPRILEQGNSRKRLLFHGAG
jgi:hypothetical protein